MNNQLCNDISRTPIRRSCNIQPCLAKPINATRRRGRGRRRRWDIGPWSLVKTSSDHFSQLKMFLLFFQCNAACGVGEQYRTIRCLAITRNRIIPDRFCQHLPIPNRVQQCFQATCSPMWVTGSWSTVCEED